MDLQYLSRLALFDYSSCFDTFSSSHHKHPLCKWGQSKFRQLWRQKFLHKKEMKKEVLIDKLILAFLGEVLRIRYGNSRKNAENNLKDGSWIRAASTNFEVPPTKAWKCQLFLFIKREVCVVFLRHWRFLTRMSEHRDAQKTLQF